jgi:nucleoside-diphosphate-sugar epimerase
MTILVTGGTGFTGSALVLRLLEAGHDVRVLDHSAGLRDGVLRRNGASLLYGSVTNAATVRQAMEGCECVYHIAAAFRELNRPESFYHAVNVEGTRHVMAAAQALGVETVVYCSTQGVHGHIDDPPGDESSPIAPEDYYQRTKYEGEEVVRAYMAQGLNATILRPTAIYGPGDPERFFLLYRFVQAGWFPMFGTGETYYHPLYIDNLVDAFLRVMPPEVGRGETYIIADEAYVTIEALVRRVAEALETKVRIVHLPLGPLRIAAQVCEQVCSRLGVSPPLFPRRADWYRQVRAFSIDKATHDLGYTPRVGLEDGLRRTAEWYWREGYLDPPSGAASSAKDPTVASSASAQP